MAEQPKTERKADFARRMGVNRATITRAEKAGRIILDIHGRVCIAESIQRWNDTKGGRTDVEARHAAERGQKTNTSLPSDDLGEGFPAADEQTEQARTEIKAEILRHDNERLRLETALEFGARIHTSHAQQAAESLGGRVRAALERMIDETAPIITGKTSPQERLEILRAQTEQIDQTISADHRAVIRRLKERA